MALRSSTRARLVLGVLAVLLPVGGMPTHAGPGHEPDPLHDPVASCDPNHQQSGNYVFAGVASAPHDHAAPTSLTIVCSYTNAKGRYISINSMPGPVVVTFGAGPRLPGVTTICASATAVYADGHTGTAPESCHPQPNLMEPPSSGDGAP